MIEPVVDLHCQIAVAHHLGPVQEQVVIVEDVLPMLSHGVRTEQLAQLLLPLDTPGKMLR